MAQVRGVWDRLRDETDPESVLNIQLIDRVDERKRKPWDKEKKIFKDNFQVFISITEYIVVFSAGEDKDR